MISKKKEQKLKDEIQNLNEDIDRLAEDSNETLMMLDEAEGLRDQLVSFTLFVAGATGFSPNDGGLTFGQLLKTIMHLRADSQELATLKTSIRKFVWEMK